MAEKTATAAERTAAMGAGTPSAANTSTAAPPPLGGGVVGGGVAVVADCASATAAHDPNRIATNTGAASSTARRMSREAVRQRIPTSARTAYRTGTAAATGS